MPRKYIIKKVAKPDIESIIITPSFSKNKIKPKTLVEVKTDVLKKNEDDKGSLEGITYKDFDLHNYRNTFPAVTLTVLKDGKPETIQLPFSDMPKICVFGGINFLNIGDTRHGKSQLLMDIARGYFNGDSDLDPDGKTNILFARNEFSGESYFMDIDQDKVGEGKGRLSEARIPNERRTNALATLLDELNLTIPQKQVEFFGMGEGRHQGISLGQDSYHLLMSACNLNRVNGDFAGISDINRALLNRFGVTFDHDYFSPTEDDKNEFLKTEATGKMKMALLRDLSPTILNIYKEIGRRTKEFNPYMEAYFRFITSGLGYCNWDTQSKKRKLWPSHCAECNFGNKDLCSLVKQSPTGTAETVKRFAHSMAYLIELKYGKDVIVDPLELVLEAFKFTTFHGNLNSSITLPYFYGEDQDQMNKAIEELRKAIEPVRGKIDQCIELAKQGILETNFIKLGSSEFPAQCKEFEYLKSKNKELNRLGKPEIQYEQFSPFTDFKTDASSGKVVLLYEEEKGLGISWFLPFIKFVSEYYKNKEVI